MDPNGPQEPDQVTRVTLKSGAPVGHKLNSLTLGAQGPHLLFDTPYLEETAHFNRERIPERVVHAKGGAAFGEFEVLNTHICKFSRAKLFSELGKKTPVAARFSHVTGESGIADTARDVRGFAVKFYTEEGNWDLVGNNLPVFFVRDPINFTSFIHTQKRNPRSHLRDPNAFWDFVACLPETLHTILMLFSDRGIPDGFRHMHGFGVNTFKLVNERQEPFYAKFHWVCEQRVRNLEEGLAQSIAGQDPDYALRDLQTAINQGHAPSWLLKFQVMSLEMAANEKDFNPLDATKTWPHAKYPLRDVGRMTLRENADNYFAQVEQLAFSPGNLVPGIECSPDRLLMGRIMSYPDAQRYRLNANYADLPVNRPRCPVLTPTYCDGVTHASNLSGSLPNYLPSMRYKRLELRQERYLEQAASFSGQVGRFELSTGSEQDNYSQPRQLYQKVLGEAQRDKLARALGQHLAGCSLEPVVERVLRHLSEIDERLAAGVRRALRPAANGASAQPPAASS